MYFHRNLKIEKFEPLVVRSANFRFNSRQKRVRLTNSIINFIIFIAHFDLILIMDIDFIYSHSLLIGQQNNAAQFLDFRLR